MAKRWFISPVLGNGMKGNAYRLKARDVPHDHQISIIVSDADGVPVLPWGLCIVSASGFAELDADAQVEPIGAVDLQATLSLLTAGQLNRLNNALTSRGVDLTGITGVSTFAEVLLRIGQKLGESNVLRMQAGP